jgi:iron complex transport system substrate-binding protein
MVLLLSVFFAEPLRAAGVQEEQPTPSELTAVDALGREVTLDAAPTRIAAVGKATMIVADALYMFERAPEHVIALGITDQGLGDFYQYLAPEFPADERISHNAGAEQIASLRPDLVLLKSYLFDGLGSQLESLGIPVFTVSLESPEDYAEEIRQMGALFDEAARAQEIIDYYDNQLEMVQERTADTPQQSVLLLYASQRDGVTAFQTAPRDWMQTFMTREAGAQAVWQDSNLTSGWQKVSLEQIASWDPDRIYIISYRTPASDFMDLIEDDPAWQSLEAFQNGDVQPFPADFHNWAQPDTRWILGLTYLASDLHAGQFEDLSMSGEIRDFYQEIYGISDKQVIDEIINRYEASVGAH